MIHFFDTNALLELGENVFKYENIFLSSVTLQELENIKTSRKKDDEVKYKARKLARAFMSDAEFNVIRPDDSIYEIQIKHLDYDDNDGLICSCAYYVKEYMTSPYSGEEFVFITNDADCYDIATKIFLIPTMTVEQLIGEKGDVYKGYKTIKGGTDYLNEIFPTLDMEVNEYLLIENTDTGECSEMRFDGENFVSLKLPESKFVKGKNALQRCALDMLYNKNIPVVAILGGYGSGKTYLSVKMAQYAVVEKGIQGKILGVREPKGEGAEIGYLAGDFEDKTDMFFLPIMQQMDLKTDEYEHLKSNEQLECNIPYYLKGTTYDETIIVLDEAEDLSAKQLKLVGTRLGKNSRIFLSGDYKQSNMNATKTNPLVRMCEELKGNKGFACIYLDDDVRGEGSKLFANLNF